MACVAGQTTARMTMTGGATGVALLQLARDLQQIIPKENLVRNETSGMYYFGTDLGKHAKNPSAPNRESKL